MPIYEYRCTKCQHQMEVLQKISDGPKRKCPECAGKLEKLISRTSFQLKGGGWFDSGYSEAKKAKASSSSSTKKSDKSDTSDTSDKSDKSDKDTSKKSGSGSDGSDSGKMKAASA